ncbi:hypothetical protein [Sporosarcina sp. FA9]|uniref:hypothetical protein n=1 Tax=Sporosarcina sp. FA9 TaxID=3413030 RepID=UPI003F654CEC
MKRQLKGLYGFRNIENEIYKAWLSSWDKNDYISLWKSLTGKSVEDIDNFLAGSIDVLKIAAEQIPINKENPNEYYDLIYHYFNEAMFHVYFRDSSNSINVGNYHEILIEVSNHSTKKQLIEGFDIVKRNGIDIVLDGSIVGYLGTMSDLFCAVFREEFIKEDYLDYAIEINQIRNIQEEFTLQLWNIPFVANADDLNILVEKILYECSVELGLEFKRGHFDTYQKEKGVSSIDLKLELSNNNYIREPLMYFNFANDSSTSRHKFIAYYQVIEFFYKRALKIARLPRPKEIDVIREVICKAITADEVKAWIEHREYYSLKHFEYPALKKLDINSVNLIEDMTNRIYSVRCSIVHAKETTNINDNFIPNLNDKIITQEIPLIKFIAGIVLESWSNFPLLEVE